MSEQAVLVELLNTADSHKIGLLTLNSEKSLNALSVPMCQIITDRLNAWRDDDDVVAILLRGAGDRAFCAGGDIRKLYDSIQENPNLPNAYAEEFFGTEYGLYRLMHFYPKPIITWGSGFVMGGGMGLFVASSHRIMTQSTRFAMPEITIGLFPDATGSWFLQRMPAGIGLFLGLTGVQCNAADAKFADIANYVLDAGSYQKLMDKLAAADWQYPHKTASELLGQLNDSDDVLNVYGLESNFARHWQATSRLAALPDLSAIHGILTDDAALANFDEKFAADAWVQKAVATYRHGCPVSAFITYELYQRSKRLSLEQSIYLDTIVALRGCESGNFAEGVRALLIDKDKNPMWSHDFDACLTSEGQKFIARHFINPYDSTQDHPLSDWLSDQSLASQFVK